MGRERTVPVWLGGLVGEKFFGGCGVHDGMKKKDKNIFCLDCCTSICPHCAPAHASHPLLQVRRYVYNDVVRLDDLQKLVNCSFVQPYTINSAKVIFLKPRPQSKPLKGSGNICLGCDRILQEPFNYCCLTCKVEHVVMQGADLSSILFRLDDSEFTFTGFDGLLDDEFGSNSIMEDPMHYKWRSGGSSGDDGDYGVKRKKSGGGGRHGFFQGMVLSFSNRRKGAPRRAPLS